MVSVGWLLYGGRYSPRLVGLSRHPDVHLWLNAGYLVCRYWPDEFYRLLDSLRDSKTPLAHAFLFSLLDERAPTALEPVVQAMLGSYPWRWRHIMVHLTLPVAAFASPAGEWMSALASIWACANVAARKRMIPAPSEVPPMSDHLSFATAMKKVAGYGLAEFLEIVSELSQESTKKGALDRRIKELISLGLALSKRCHRCIDIHGREALRIGASDGEVEQVRRIVLYMNAAPDTADAMWGSWAESWRDYARHRGPLADYERELVALAVAIQRQQGSQLDLHARAAMAAGASPEQVAEVLPITLLMDGAPALSQIPRVMAVIEAESRG